MKSYVYTTLTGIRHVIPCEVHMEQTIFNACNEQNRKKQICTWSPSYIYIFFLHPAFSVDFFKVDTQRQNEQKKEKKLYSERIRRMEGKKNMK